MGTNILCQWRKIFCQFNPLRRKIEFCLLSDVSPDPSNPIDFNPLAVKGPTQSHLFILVSAKSNVLPLTSVAFVMIVVCFENVWGALTENPQSAVRKYGYVCIHPVHLFVPELSLLLIILPKSWRKAKSQFKSFQSIPKSTKNDDICPQVTPFFFF